MNDTTFQGDGKVAYVPVVVDAKPKPITNADRIRSKSDEELATLFEEYGDCPPRYCPHDGKGAKITRIDCTKCWLDWLKEVNNGKEEKEENQSAK